MMEESSNSSEKNNYSEGNTNNTSDGVGLIIKKGPWKPEEDQVLINHVNKYGPRDWSSIRSKGLLRRTGKSCRLRWVNKLRPDLKIGCKFTAEEERLVIELQSELGNKWATIAKHLSGRTDNDVKNFWSSRQKRLARILPSSHPAPPPPPPPPPKRLKSSSSNLPLFLQVPKTGYSEGETCSKAQCSFSASSQTGIALINPNDPISEAPNDINYYPCPIPLTVSPSNTLQLEEMSFPSIPLPTETRELIDRLDSDFLQSYGYIDDEPAILADDGGSSQLLSCCGAEMWDPPGANKGVIMDDSHPVTPDSFFDDFPSDMFDIEPLPSPSSW